MYVVRQCSAVPIAKYITILQDDSRSGRDYKASQRYADFMQDDNEGVSDFAKKKSLKEQREYLPIFAVRQEVDILLLLILCGFYPQHPMFRH